MNETYFSIGGNVPAISLFDENGLRIGQHKPSKGEKVLQGHVAPVDVKSSQVEATGAGIQSEYISLTMDHDDALCISYISMVWPDTQNTQRAWYGDVRYRCGGDWYHSELIAGDNNYKPKCTWLDANHSNKLRFQGMGIHISDFEATDERTEQYQKHPGTMCKSQPRFHLYEKLKPDGILPVFFPPLVFNENLTDTNFTQVVGVAGVMADGAIRPGTAARRSVEKNSSAAGISKDGPYQANWSAANMLPTVRGSCARVGRPLGLISCPSPRVYSATWTLGRCGHSVQTPY